jgi:RNA processing factor Prp31
MAAMELGLAHSLSRYKLKFSPDKIDTMIVQVATVLSTQTFMTYTFADLHIH